MECALEAHVQLKLRTQVVSATGRMWRPQEVHLTGGSKPLGAMEECIPALAPLTFFSLSASQ